MTFYSLHHCGVHKSNLVVTYICSISQYSVDLFICLFIIIIVTIIIVHLVRRGLSRYAISVISLQKSSLIWHITYCFTIAE